MIFYRIPKAFSSGSLVNDIGHGYTLLIQPRVLCIIAFMFPSIFTSFTSYLGELEKIDNRK